MGGESCQPGAELLAQGGSHLLHPTGVRVYEAGDAVQKVSFIDWHRAGRVRKGGWQTQNIELSAPGEIAIYDDRVPSSHARAISCTGQRPGCWLGETAVPVYVKLRSGQRRVVLWACGSWALILNMATDIKKIKEKKKWEMFSPYSLMQVT